MQLAKDKLLSVLVSYIKEGKDLEDIALSTIAKDAEIGKSTVYEYFSSKDEMIEETYRYLLKHYEDILLADLELMDFESAFKEEIKRSLLVMKDAQTLMEAIMKHPSTKMMRLNHELKGEINRIQDAMQKRFESIMRVGVIEQKIPAKNPHPHKRYVIQALISGLMFQFVHQEMDLTEDALITLIYQEVINTLS